MVFFECLLRDAIPLIDLCYPQLSFEPSHVLASVVRGRPELVPSSTELPRQPFKLGIIVLERSAQRVLILSRQKTTAAIVLKIAFAYCVPVLWIFEVVTLREPIHVAHAVFSCIPKSVGDPS